MEPSKQIIPLKILSAIYSVREILGRGAYGEVFRVVRIDDNQEFAMKKMIFND